MKRFLLKILKKIKPKTLSDFESLLLVVLLIISFCLTILFTLPGIKILVDRVLVDDAFYYFKVAKNVADGHGFTFDGINPTNGFQPLWQFILIPIFFLFKNDLMALKAVIIISGLLHLIAGGLIFVITKKIAGKWWGLLATFIWLFSTSIFKVGISGMESSILAVTFLSFVLLTLKTIEEINHPKILFLWGLAIGFVSLSRVEASFLVFIIGLYLFFALRKQLLYPWKKILYLLIHFLLGFGLVFGPYILWNLIYFKTLTPISGQVKFYYAIGPEGIKKIFSLDFIQKSWSNLKLYTKYVFDLVFGSFSVYINKVLFIKFKISFPRLYFNQLLVLLILCALSVTLFKKQYFKIPQKYRLFLLFLLIFGIIHFVAIATLLYNHILYAIWYFPIEFSSLIILSVLTAKKIYQDWLTPIFTFAMIPKIMAGFFILTLVFFIKSQFFYIKEETTRPADANVSTTVRFYESSTWINTNIPPNSRIGAFSAGILGFFSKNSVINLDGYINSKDYFEHLKKNRFREYVEEKNIKYIADYFTYDPLKEGVNWCGQLPPKNLEVLTKWPLPEGKTYMILKYSQDKK